MVSFEKTRSNYGVYPIKYGGMDAFRLRIPRDFERGITEAVVLRNGFNIVSEKAVIKGQAHELLRTRPENEIKAFLEADPNNFFMIANALLCPWANRIWGKKEGKLLRASWDGQSRLLPMNFPNEGTSIHGLIYDRLYQYINCFETDHSVVLVGITQISDSEWFSSLNIVHEIELFSSGALRRNVLVDNTGVYKALASVGEHLYIDIPEGQKREDVTLDTSAQSVVRVDDKLRPLRSEPDVLTKLGGDHFKYNFPLALGTLSLDHCFTHLIDPKQVKIGFPALGWGVSIEGRTVRGGNPINAVQIYSPTDLKAIACGSVAVEMQGNLPDPLDPDWKDHSDFGPMGYTGSGMKVLRPGGSLDWEVIHSVYPIKS